MRVRRRVGLGLSIVVIALGCLAVFASTSRYARALQLLRGLAAPATANAAPASPLVVEELSLPSELGPIRARLYRADRGVRARGVVLAHGLHYRGIDERRFVPFARALAATGLVVLTPELSELADYRVTAQGVGVIDASVRYLSAQRAWIDERRVGLLGFSFAGGLSLVAASDPGLQQHLAYVTSVGGHHDLERVLRFFRTNQVSTPAGMRSGRAHDYGLVVLIYGHLERFVPEADLALMRRALRLWLQEEHELAWAVASERTEPTSELLFERVAQGRLQELGPDIDALIEHHREQLRRLSPAGRLGAIHVPVYLLHGASDNVIPSGETEWASVELGSSEHEALVSPLLDHVQLGGTASWSNTVRLVSFVGRWL